MPKGCPSVATGVLNDRFGHPVPWLRLDQHLRRGGIRFGDFRPFLVATPLRALVSVPAGRTRLQNGSLAPGERCWPRLSEGRRAIPIVNVDTNRAAINAQMVQCDW